MAIGFGGCDNFQDTIKATVDNGVDFARSNLFSGVSSTHCRECGDRIPEKRRMVLVVHYCISCQTFIDKKQPSLYNRRGSKDSQLR